METRNYCRNEGGFSLLEILLAFALMGILSVFMMDMFRFQHGEARSLTDKLVSLDLKRELQSTIEGENFCSCLTRTRTFRTTAINASNNISPAIQSIPRRYLNPVPSYPTACTEAAPRLIPASGNRVEGTNLVIDSLEYTDVIHRGAGVYAGDLRINFEKESNRRVVKSINIPLVLSVDTSSGSPNARPILSCGVSLPEERFMAFFNPATVPSGLIVDTGAQACRGSQVSITYGGRYLTDDQGDNQGRLYLRVNGVDVSERQGGGRTGGGDLTRSGDSIHGVHIMPCSGNIRARTRWVREEDNPQFEKGYVQFRFFD